MDYWFKNTRVLKKRCKKIYEIINTHKNKELLPIVKPEKIIVSSYQYLTDDVCEYYGGYEIGTEYVFQEIYSIYDGKDNYGDEIFINIDYYFYDLLNDKYGEIVEDDNWPVELFGDKIHLKNLQREKVLFKYLRIYLDELGDK